MARLLFGPCDDPTFFDRFLKSPVDEGRWGVFGARCPGYEAAAQSLPGGPPDALVVWPGYTSVPAWVWGAPVPVVAAAHDPNFLWSGFRHTLLFADLVLTDAPSAERKRRAGLSHVRAANLFGLDRHFAAGIDEPEGDRDLDVVFAGNAHPDVQAERRPWLARVAALSERFKVRVVAGVFGAEYRALLRRAKVAFNRAVRGECNLRALEAAASGAVLLQESENAEVREYLQPGAEFVPYTSENLEAVVADLLADGSKRAAIAAAARDRARWLTFDALIGVALAVGGKGWAEVKDRARARRAATPRAVPLAGRVWQRAALAGPDADSNLTTDLTAAGDRHAIGALSADPAAAEPHFAAAAAGGNRASLVARAAVLAEVGRTDEAVAVAREAAAALAAAPELTAAESDAVPCPLRFDALRVGWERAGYEHPDDPVAERREKARLLRARAIEQAARVTGTVGDWAAAWDAVPEQPRVRAALGMALLRAGRRAEAVEHLRAAVAADPFDNATAAALLDALAAGGSEAEAEAVRACRRVLAAGAPGLVTCPEPATAAVPIPSRPSEAEAPTMSAPAPEPVATPDPPPAVAPAPIPQRPRTRFVDLPADAFTLRFGNPDTRAALCGFTPPHDTHAVLTLVAHARPRRALEVGTAAGHMTANLTAFTAPDAIVYSIGLIAGARSQSGAAAQEYEVPRPDQFARHLNHFGAGHKARLIVGDSRVIDFATLSPLDFAFIDGGHDLATARADSRGAYAALRPGGVLAWHDVPSPVPWVEVERAITELTFPEIVYRVAGTQVAFLVKGEGVGALAPAHSGRVAVVWDGEFAAAHSLALVNRAACAELAARGHDVALVPSPSRVAGATPLPLPTELAPLVGRDLPGAVQVRHRWPPDLSAPSGGGPFVLIQPWEFGRLPRAWVEPILTSVDEVWCYSRAVLRAYVASGVPEERLALVPPGVDPDRFRPGLDPLPLATAKRVKLLFVGGTIPRKGFDALLAAYARAFTAADGVCLAVKDVGAGTFYRDQTAADAVRAHQSTPGAAEVLYLAEDLSEADLPRLYAGCDALVHPYRGEGFGLPVLEAMACGLPVAVTAGGPTDEFVPPSAGWRIPARVRYFDREAVGDLPTAGRPWWLEPDPDALVGVLREVVAGAAERQRRGRAARRAALGWTWARTAAAVEDRARVLRARTPVRFRTPPATVLPVMVGSAALPAPTASPRADEPLVVPARVPEAIPAVPTGRPRVSLTMIVRNEEHNLPACLASIRDLVDEAVVIDTGSTDRTVAIAQSFGCVLGSFPWVDSFAAARNAALDPATGEYAFWMDADDRLDETNRTKLKALFGSLPAGNAAFVMTCLCVGDGPDGARTDGAGTAVDHVRLFRRHPDHRWTYRVHEQILPALRATGADVRWSDVTVRHVGYLDPAVRRRKLDRDLRLLNLDAAEKPGDPFTLFNLGSVYHERGDARAAAEALERSLAGSHPKDSIVRKTYALLARCRLLAGDRAGASEACRRGREHYPDDAELLFLAAGYARDGGDPGAAERLYRQLIGGSEGPHFASVDTGLRAVKGRHNLAVLLLDQNRLPEAEGLWRAALTHDPHFLPAQVGLGEVAVAAGNRAALERQASELEGAGAEGTIEAAVLRARWHTRRGEHPAAAALLEAAAERHPGALGVRVALSHARIAADAAPDLLEAAFRGVLALDPGNEQAKRNLDVLYRKTGRHIEGVIDPNGGP